MDEQTKWVIDKAHSEIGFKVKHLMIAYVKGTFKSFDARIYTTGNDFKTAIIDLWIDTSSITTGDIKRDEHLKSPDFFDVQRFKEINFTSSMIARPDSENNHALWGELTMLGVTQRIGLNVLFGGISVDQWGAEKAGFTISGKIKRKDWGMDWNAKLEKGGYLVSDDILISGEIELIAEINKDHLVEWEPTGNKVIL